MGFATSQQWENFFGIIVLQFVGHSPVILSWLCPPLLSFCGFFFDFGCGVSCFSRFQHPPVDCCSTASCDFSTLTGADVHMSFTLPSWPRSPLQYSCVENLKARGAWRATVHKVVNSQTQLRWLRTHAAPSKRSLFNIPSSSLSPWTSPVYFLLYKFVYSGHLM